MVLLHTSPNAPEKSGLDFNLVKYDPELDHYRIPFLYPTFKRIYPEYIPASSGMVRKNTTIKSRLSRKIATIFMHLINIFKTALNAPDVPLYLAFLTFSISSIHIEE